MDAKPARKLTVLDAMILIASVAVGLAWMRFFQDYVAGGENYPDKRESVAWIFPVRVFVWWVMSSWHCVAAVTIALLALRFRKPRPPLRRLARQPGTAALGAVVLGVSVDLFRSLSYMVYGIIRAGSFEDWNSYAYYDLSGYPESLAVASAWLALAAGGRWRVGRDWIDRLGLALGVFWLVTPPLCYLVEGVSQVLGSWWHTG